MLEVERLHIVKRSSSSVMPEKREESRMVGWRAVEKILGSDVSMMRE
jgi:hypothetical protein